MPDQEQLDDFLEALETAGSPAKNVALREALGWEEPLYEEVKAELVRKRIVVRGKGRSDSVSMVGAEPVAQQHAQPSNGRKAKATTNGTAKDKSLESWIWDAACSIRGAKDAPKYKDYILPLIFTKRLCDVFDDELNRIAAEVGSRKKAFQLVAADHKLVRFYLPLVPGDPEQPVWSVIRKLSDKIGEGVTTQMRAIARENPRLQGIIDRVDFNATTHGQRDLDDDRLDKLIEAISTKRLGLSDVEADIIGKSYEYLIRKFAEGSGQSAGEFYTPPEVGSIMSKVLQPGPGMEIYDPCCGSGGLLVKCEIAMEESVRGSNGAAIAPLKLFGQEYVPET
jgi:type I restriction enzyme M protein